VANRLGARFCILIGGDELAAGTVTIKDMADGTQWEAPRDRAVPALREVLVADEQRGTGAGSC